MGRVCHWALFHLLLIFHSIFINQAMVSTTSLKFALGFFMFQNNVFLSISEWLSNLPNDCDQYIQAFTLPPFPLWCQLPVCKTHVNVAVWPKLKFFCGFSIIEYLEIELNDCPGQSEDFSSRLSNVKQTCPYNTYSLSRVIQVLSSFSWMPIVSIMHFIPIKPKLLQVIASFFHE